MRTELPGYDNWKCSAPEGEFSELAQLQSDVRASLAAAASRFDSRKWNGVEFIEIETEANTRSEVNHPILKPDEEEVLGEIGLMVFAKGDSVSEVHTALADRLQLVVDELRKAV